MLLAFGTIAGGVAAFLCGGGSKPAPCVPGTTISGTIMPADVIGPAGQGIAPGEWNELVAAIRAGVAYANVHSTTQPGGESALAPTVRTRTEFAGDQVPAPSTSPG